jgi:prophage regulatory protein
MPAIAEPISAASETRLIRLPEVIHLTGLGRSQLYALAQADQFPRPLKLSQRCSAWQETAVRAWIADRIAAHTRKAAA